MKKIVVLTGAGISSESGITTFRDADGLWDKNPIDDVATPQGWRKNPALVLDFYNRRRKQILSAQPNEGHRALVELEKNYSVHIITQNVDDLHERAGSSQILHLHGELMKVRSTGPDRKIYNLNPENFEVHLGHKCSKGYQLRPHVVWFGEKVHEIDSAIKLTKEADIFLIVGTSINSYPAVKLIDHLKPETQVYYIHPKATNDKYPNVKAIPKAASEGLKTFLKEHLKQ